jgi:hypothetical protein
MLGAGDIAGWLVSGPEPWEFIAGYLEDMKAKLQFLFAGDGNHSLATAKMIWEEHKAAKPGDEDGTLRWALVEIENLYDLGIVFGAIHRLVLETSVNEVLNVLSDLPGFAQKTIQ